MKLAPPTRFLLSAILVVFAVLFGLGQFHAEDDPEDVFVYDRSESVLHLSLDAPGGTMIIRGGAPVTVGIYVQRHSWEIWRQPSTGTEEFREATTSPAVGTAVNLSLSWEMGSLGESTVTTNSEGYASTVYTPSGPASGGYVYANAEDSSASLYFDMTATPLIEETWSYSHTEATLVAELSCPAPTTEVIAGETRDLSLLVRYETWDVMTGSQGNSRTENHTSAPAVGAAVNWISESGDGSVSGYGNTDSSGLCQGNLTMGSGDAVVRADISYASGQATSASLYFSAAPYTPPSGDPVGGDPSTEWIFSRSEITPTITNLSLNGSAELSQGDSRTITGEVSQEVWDIWVNGYGNEERRFNYSGPGSWFPVSVSLDSGDGNLSSNHLTTDGQGWFSFTYTMGASTAQIVLNPDVSTAASPNTTTVTLYSYTGTSGGGGPMTPEPLWTHLYTQGNYRIDGPHSDAHTYDLPAGTNRIISGTLYWDSWEVWGDQYGNTNSQNPVSTPLSSTSLSLGLSYGDGTLADSQVTTDSQGAFSTPFTMGSVASRVRLQIGEGTSYTAAGELDFTPTPAGPEDDFVKIRDESSLFVSLTAGAPQVGADTDITIPLHAQVTETTWEVWENGVAPAELRNYRTGPAIGASVSFSISNGSGTLNQLDSVTDADGAARASISPTQADTIVVANASFLTTNASGEIIVSPVQWTYQNTESRLVLTLEQMAGLLTGTVRLQTWENWVHPVTGAIENRQHSEGPASNAELTYESLPNPGFEIAGFGNITTMTGTDGTGATTYTSLGQTWVQVTAGFAGMAVIELIQLPASFQTTGAGSGDGTGTGSSGSGTGGNGNGGANNGGTDSGSNPTQSNTSVNLRGRHHETSGGSGTIGSEVEETPDAGKDTVITGEGPDLAPYHELLNLAYSHAEYEEVTLYERFEATLVRDTLAADGFTVTGEEERSAEGLMSEKDQILNPLLANRWRILEMEELVPYMGYRWEVSFASSINTDIPADDATGEPLEIRARITPSSDVTLLEELASAHAVKSLYEQLGSPPDPSIYWTGSVGDMAFSDAPWTTEMRIEEGNSDSNETSSAKLSYADFISGVTPSVKWSEYWGQSNTTVPQDGAPAKSTVVFLAKSTDENEETTTGTVVVTFTIEPGKQVSTETPVIESSSGSMGDWIVAQSDGTVRAEPPVERGKKNEVSVAGLAMEGVSEEDEESDKNIIIINANNDNDSTWTAETMDTIPTTRDFEHGGGLPKDDEELKPVKVSAPDQAGIEVKIKILPKEKVKAWKNRNKTEQIGIGADGTLSFPNDKITDFYVEGVKVSDAKAEITMTMEVKEGQRNQDVDTIKFAVGPILEDLKVDDSSSWTSGAYTLPNESLQRVVFSPGQWDKAKGVPVKGIKTTATVVRGDALAGTEFPKVRFIQNLLSEGVRDVYYSDPERENPVKHLGIDGSGLDFPLLDANPNGDPLFYEQDFGSNGDDYFVYDSVPTMPGALSDYTDPGTGETRRQKFDRLILKADFKTFIVIEFDDGTVFPLGNIKWDLDGEMEAELDGSGPDKRTINVKKKKLNHDGQPTRSHDAPETMIPPYPNDVLQLQTQ